MGIYYDLPLLTNNNLSFMCRTHFFVVSYALFVLCPTCLVSCEKYHKYYLQQQFTVGPIQINILIKMHYYMYMATIAHTL